jgi:hypothetical protein
MPRHTTENGNPTTKDDPARALWYAFRCGYHTDDWDKLKKFGPGIPCCPCCGGPGFVTTVTNWDRVVAKYDAMHPGYAGIVRQCFEKCHDLVGGIGGLLKAANLDGD